MTANETATMGAMGLDYGTAGSVAQAIGAQAVDRGNVTADEVRAFLTADDGAYESDLWDVLGPFIDRIEDAILADHEERSEIDAATAIQNASADR